MIALLVAAATAFFLSILGTPLLIRILRARGIGQLIRDDGPFAHPHVEKAGTPTMGGIALVGSALIGYGVAHIRTEQIKFARAGVTLATTTSAYGWGGTSGCANAGRRVVRSSSRVASRSSPSTG